MSKHHKRREPEGNNTAANSLLGKVDIGQLVQLLANMNRRPEPQNNQQGNGLDGLGNLFQTFLSAMKNQGGAAKNEDKEEEAVKPEEVIVEEEEPVQVYSNEELTELIEQLKTLITTLQSYIEHKEDA